MSDSIQGMNRLCPGWKELAIYRTWKQEKTKMTDCPVTTSEFLRRRMGIKGRRRWRWWLWLLESLSQYPACRRAIHYIRVYHPQGPQQRLIRWVLTDHVPSRLYIPLISGKGMDSLMHLLRSISKKNPCSAMVCLKQTNSKQSGGGGIFLSFP